MVNAPDFACSICGELNREHAHWFLVTENRWEDKLKILEWDRQLATQRGVHPACSPCHVQELVVHWMATGSVHHPFAQTTIWDTNIVKERPCSETTLVDTRGVRTISELTIHRESVRRVLRENPESFRSMMHALQGALQQCAPAIQGGDGVLLQGFAH